jgi:hypothetical protein
VTRNLLWKEYFPSAEPYGLEYDASNTGSDGAIQCDSKITQSSCEAVTGCSWYEFGSSRQESLCYYNHPYSGLSDHQADVDYTAKDDIQSMPATALCSGKSLASCTGECAWIRTYTPDYDFGDGFSEREGECYPVWPSVKAELESNGAPAGTVGHWRYKSYSLAYCVGETKSECETLSGCSWWSFRCRESCSVRAKALDSDCGNFASFDFDQFFDDSTPSLSDYMSPPPSPPSCSRVRRSASLRYASSRIYAKNCYNTVGDEPPISLFLTLKATCETYL